MLVTLDVNKLITSYLFFKLTKAWSTGAELAQNLTAAASARREQLGKCEREGRVIRGFGGRVPGKCFGGYALYILGNALFNGSLSKFRTEL